MSKEKQVVIDTASRDKEAASLGDSQSENYLEAQKIRQIANISKAEQAEKNEEEKAPEQKTRNEASEKENAGSVGQKILGERKARMLQSKLTREAERLEGYGWAERSHTGIMALIAAVVRAVRYIIDPVYRNQVKMMNQMVNSEYVRNAMHSQRQMYRQETEPSVQKKEPEEKAPSVQYEETKKEPEITALSAHDETKEMQKDEENPEAKDSRDSRKDMEVEKYLEVPLRLTVVREENITPETAAAVLKKMREADYKETLESLTKLTKDEQYAKKEAERTTQPSSYIQLYPVLVKGLSEKEQKECAAQLLINNPEAAVCFSEDVLKEAASGVVSQVRDKFPEQEEEIIGRIITFANQFQGLRPVLDKFVEMGLAEFEEIGETEYHAEDYERDNFDDDGYDKFGYDKDGFNKNGYNRFGYNRDGYDVQGYDESGYDRDRYDKDGYDECDRDKEGFSRTGYDREGYNRDGYNRYGYDRDGYDKDGGHEPWYFKPAFSIALYEVRRSNYFASDSYDWETQKMITMERYPELLKELMPDEQTYEAVLAAASVRPSVLNYIAEGTIYYDKDGVERDINDILKAVREQMPKKIEEIAIIMGMTHDTALEQILQDVEECSDRSYVTDLKNQIRVDFEQREVQWEKDAEREEDFEH